MLTDLCYALRQLAKSPGFTVVAILTLALGIGSCTAIFSVVNSVLLHPLNYPNSDRIVVLKATQLPQFPEFSVSAPDFMDWQGQSKSYVAVAAYQRTALNMTGSGEPERILGEKGTGHFFDVYSTTPVLGRTFSPEEDVPGKNQVVVISFSFWQRAFGGARDVIGRVLQFDGEPYTVIGVVPATFRSAAKIDAWVPMALTPEETANERRGSHDLTVVGRLKPGVTAAQADAELKVICAQLAQQYPDSNKGWSAYVMPLLDYLVKDVRVVLYTLLAAVGCVLLIACANVANLLLARATARHKEISIRAALGASRTRLVRQLLTESILLALAGGVLGVFIANWGLHFLISISPVPRSAEVHLDIGVLAFSLALSAATGMLFGLVPAWLTASANASEALKQGSRGSTEGGARTRLRGVVVILELAFAVVLLAGTGLLVRSFMKLTHVDPGFTPENAVEFRLALPEKKYAKPEQQVAFAGALLDQLRALPGARAAGLTHVMPLVGDWVLSFRIDGRPAVAPSDQPNTNYYSVTPDYFHAMGIRLVRGRLFTPRDDAAASHVAIINETFARQHFPNEDPLGKRVEISGKVNSWSEIVGIVGDVTQYGVDKVTPSQAYEPFAQKPYSTFNVVIRTKDSSDAVLGSLRPAVYAVDKDQPIGSIVPLKEVMAESLETQRFAMLLLTTFSGIGLVIAAVGIYGVMAYSVAQRTGEFGIRMALGAQRSDVLQLVLAQGGRLIGLGLLIGLAATMAAARALESMLFRTSTHDPVTLVAIMAVLGVVALIACLYPALRATKVNPMEALRAE